MTASWPLSRQSVLDANGRPVRDARARFFASGTSTPITVFADPGRAQPLPQPVVCDASGRFPRVYLPDGLYAEEVSSAAAGLSWYDDGLGVPLDDATGPEVPTLPPASSFHVTGDVKWRLDGGIQPGFVRMNGRSIGNVGSGASERADADTRPLYAYLWLSFADDIATVIGGRGLGWEEDFNAGKPITVPSMRGCLAAGLDTMGSTSAGLLETVTLISLEPGSARAAVGDATRLALHMLVIADGVTFGTRIIDIAGTVITMSAPANPGASGVRPARFGLVDSERPGAFGGDMVRPIANRNLEATLPGGTTTYDPPAFTIPQYAELINIRADDGGTVEHWPGVWRAVQGNTVDQFSAQLDVENLNPGGGVPFASVQALRVGTYYMKL